MSEYTGNIVEQWACDTTSKKSKASKNVLTAIQKYAVLKMKEVKMLFLVEVDGEATSSSPSDIAAYF